MIYRILRAGLSATVLLLFLQSMDLVPNLASAAKAQPKKTSPKKVKTKIDKKLYDPSVSAEIKWIGPQGGELKYPVRHKSAWTWEKNKKSAPPYIPTMKTWIQLPSGETLLKFQAENLQLIKDPQDAPFDSSGEVFALESSEQVLTGTLWIKNSKNEIQELGFIIQRKEADPKILVHDSCKSADVFIHQKAPGGSHKFLAASCVEQGEKIQLYTQVSEESRFIGAKSRKGIISLKIRKNNWRLYEIHTQHPKLKPESTFAYFRAGEKSSRKASLYEIMLKTDAPKDSRWSFVIGTEVSYFNYREDPIGVSLREITLTLKLGAVYRISDKFDFGTSVFANIFPLSHAPADVPSSRVYGINARLAYRLPFRWKKATFKAMLGWYYWGMLVEDNSYGISSLVGPQIFLLSSFQKEDNRALWLYLKYAPISGTLTSYTFSNFEFAIGGGYQLSPARTERPLFLNLNFATIRANATGASNTLKTHVISSGVSMVF